MRNYELARKYFLCEVLQYKLDAMIVGCFGVM